MKQVVLLLAVTMLFSGCAMKLRNAKFGPQDHNQPQDKSVFFSAKW